MAKRHITNGWKGESRRHSFASSGTRTRKALNTSASDLSIFVSMKNNNKQYFVQPDTMSSESTESDPYNTRFDEVLDRVFLPKAISSADHYMERLILFNVLGGRNKTFSNKILTYLLMRRNEIMDVLNNNGDFFRDIYKTTMVLLIQSLNTPEEVKQQFYKLYELEDIVNKMERQDNILRMLREIGVFPKRGDDEYLHPIITVIGYTNHNNNDMIMGEIYDIIKTFINGKPTRDEINAIISYMMSNDSSFLFRTPYYIDLTELDVLFNEHLPSRNLDKIRKVDSIFAHNEKYKLMFKGWQIKDIGLTPTIMDVLLFIDNKYKDEMPLSMKEAVYIYDYDSKVIVNSGDKVVTAFFVALYDVMKERGIKNIDKVEVWDDESQIKDVYWTEEYRFYKKFIEAVLDNRKELIELYKKYGRTGESSDLKKIQNRLKTIIRQIKNRRGKNPHYIQVLNDYIFKSPTLLERMSSYTDRDIEDEPIQLYDAIREKLRKPIDDSIRRFPKQIEEEYDPDKLAGLIAKATDEDDNAIKTVINYIDEEVARKRGEFNRMIFRAFMINYMHKLGYYSDSKIHPSETKVYKLMTLYYDLSNKTMNTERADQIPDGYYKNV